MLLAALDAYTRSARAPFTTAGWRKMVARLGVAAKLGFKAHPHMFRHACGFQLANQGTDTRTLQAYSTFAYTVVHDVLERRRGPGVQLSRSWSACDEAQHYFDANLYARGSSASSGQLGPRVPGDDGPSAQKLNWSLAERGA